MSPVFTAYSTNDLKQLLIRLGFKPGVITADGEAILYCHPDKTRESSQNNCIPLPLHNVMNRHYASKLLDDLLSFGFTKQDLLAASK